MTPQIRRDDLGWPARAPYRAGHPATSPERGAERHRHATLTRGVRSGAPAGELVADGLRQLNAVVAAAVEYVATDTDDAYGALVQALGDAGVPVYPSVNVQHAGAEVDTKVDADRREPGGVEDGG